MPYGMGFGQAGGGDPGGGPLDFWKQLFRDFKTRGEHRDLNRRINVGRLENPDLYGGDIESVPLAGTAEERQAAREDFFRGLEGENDPTTPSAGPTVLDMNDMSQSDRIRWNRYMTKLAAGLGDPANMPAVVPTDYERQIRAATGG